MKRLFVLLLLCCAVITLKGQTQLFGQIDITDLKLVSCDFEKGAGAMVLFDKTEVNTINSITTVNRHKRIKIFTEKGLDAANITIGYYSRDYFEKVSDFEAQTINLDHDAIKVTPVDKSQIFKQATDKNTKTLTFSFPGVKAGSVIEYAYKLTIDFPGALPDWKFQGDLPVRYSELNTNISTGFVYKIFPRAYNGYEKNIKEAIRGTSGDSIGTHYLWAVKNTGSFKDEPYTTCPGDNIQDIRFFLFKTPFDNIRPHATTWSMVTGLWMNDPDTKEQMNKNLKDDDMLLATAKSLPNDEEKIGYIFNKIKSTVKWDGVNNNDTYDGVKKAWEKRQGNSAEINLILFNFLRMAGIKCNPTYVSTRDNGKVETDLPSMDDFNTLVLTVTTSTQKTYVLDASNKFNFYNAIPFNLLNCYSLMFDPDKKSYDIKIIKNGVPLKKIVLVNAQIKTGGKLEGFAHIISFGCNKTHNLQQYANLGDAKYKDELRNNDNNLKILSLQRENIETDTLPLNESINLQRMNTPPSATFIKKCTKCSMNKLC